jgi:hypothetical protein
MKSITAVFLVGAILVAGCGTTTGAKHASTIGAWSDVVDNMRGRLILEPTLDGEGFRSTKVLFEIENLGGLRHLIFTKGAGCFTWKVTNAGKEALPRWNGPLPWIYDFSQMSYQITLPAWATLRLPVSGATYYILRPGPLNLSSSSLVLVQDEPNNPWHLTSGSSIESYFLSATFQSASEVPGDKFWWKGRLSLPPVLLPTDASPRRDIASPVR